MASEIKITINGDTKTPIGQRQHQKMGHLVYGSPDRLYRGTPFDFPHLIKSHNTTEEEAFRYLIKKKDARFVTKTAQCKAEGEIRKKPNAHLLNKLF